MTECIDRILDAIADFADRNKLVAFIIAWGILSALMFLLLSATTEAGTTKKLLFSAFSGIYFAWMSPAILLILSLPIKGVLFLLDSVIHPSWEKVWAIILFIVAIVAIYILSPFIHTILRFIGFYDQ